MIHFIWWDNHIAWGHYFNWQQVLFVVVVGTETGLALLFHKRLFFRKPKIANEIDCVNNTDQNVSALIRPMCEPSDAGTERQNDTEASPEPIEHIVPSTIRARDSNTRKSGEQPH